MPAELETLVLAAAAGDTQAYGRLIDRTSSLVSSIAVATVGDLELSRDIAQEVFLCVWRDLKKLRNPSSFLPWLRQVARNRARTALRTMVKQRKLGVSGVLDDLAPVLADPNPGIAEQMVSREESERLSEALSSLPDDAREVLVLYYREEQSISQVAQLLELSEVAVKKRLSRARFSLRARLLEPTGDTLGRTVPGAAFTAAVISALPLAAPPIGAAASAAVSKATAKSFWLWKLPLSFSGSIVGAVAGVLGVLHGSVRLLKEAYDEEERRSLRIHTYVSVTLVVFYAVAFPLGWLWTHSRIFGALWFIAFALSVAVLQHPWLGHILKRRREAEMRLDPVAATERRRRERRQAIIGWTLGLGLGSLGLFLGLWFAK